MAMSPCLPTGTYCACSWRVGSDCQHPPESISCSIPALCAYWVITATFPPSRFGMALCMARLIGGRFAVMPSVGEGKIAVNDIIKIATEGPPLELLTRYGCGPIRFSGHDDALYERHLLFDDVVAPEQAGPRERFEAIARAVRDVLSQRWILTEGTYDRENPKRIYYLSMEFLIGRSLSNNVVNLLLEPFARRLAAQRNLDLLGVLEQEPDAGLGNGGLGRLAACFLDSMATMQLPAMGYGLRYEYGMFRQSIKNGWQREKGDNWLRRPDPWEVARPQEKVDVKLNCS